MTSAQVLETSVKVISNSPSQDKTHPDDRTLLNYDIYNCVTWGHSLHVPRLITDWGLQDQEEWDKGLYRQDHPR